MYVCVYVTYRMILWMDGWKDGCVYIWYRGVICIYCRFAAEINLVFYIHISRERKR